MDIIAYSGENVNHSPPTPEQAEVITSLIGEHCNLWPNVKDRDNVIVHYDPVEPGVKNWKTGGQLLNTSTFVHSLIHQTHGYGIKHRVFTRALILDIDRSDLEPVAIEVLKGLGLRVSLHIASGGPGRSHLWILFDALPRHLIHKYGSPQAVVKRLGESIRDRISPDGRGIDIRGDGGSGIANPASWNPYYRKYLWPVDCQSWDSFIEVLKSIPINKGELITSILPDLEADPQPVKSRQVETIDTTECGPGETNDFTLAFVTEAYRRSQSWKSVESQALAFYHSDGYSARASERDFISRIKCRFSWRSSRSGTFNPMDSTEISGHTLRFWQRLCESRKATDLQIRCIALLEMCATQAHGGVFYFSMRQAAQFGISRGTFVGTIRKFSDVIRIHKRGENHYGIGRRNATEYYLAVPIPLTDPGESESVEFVGLNQLSRLMSWDWSLDAEISPIFDASESRMKSGSTHRSFSIVPVPPRECLTLRSDAAEFHEILNRGEVVSPDYLLRESGNPEIRKAGIFLPVAMPGMEPYNPRNYDTKD